jgi:hypothetical protein
MHAAQLAGDKHSTEEEAFHRLLDIRHLADAPSRCSIDHYLDCIQRHVWLAGGNQQRKTVQLLSLRKQHTHAVAWIQLLGTDKHHLYPHLLSDVLIERKTKR